MRPTEHYAESFTVMPGRCFRLITRPTAHGQPDHCPELVAWHGTFIDRTGRRWEVDACDRHGYAVRLVLRSPPSSPSA